MRQFRYFPPPFSPPNPLLHLIPRLDLYVERNTENILFFFHPFFPYTFSFLLSFLSLLPFILSPVFHPSALSFCYSHPLLIKFSLSSIPCPPLSSFVSCLFLLRSFSSLPFFPYSLLYLLPVSSIAFPSFFTPFPPSQQ